MSRKSLIKLRNTLRRPCKQPNFKERKPQEDTDTIQPDEIGIKELSDILYCNHMTVAFFIKKKIIKVKRIVFRKKVFDRQQSVGTLSLFLDNGRLSTRMDIWKKGVRAIKQSKPPAGNGGVK